MKVKIHTLFQYLLDTTETDPEAFVGFSLSESPRLGEFMDALDPALPLDWNQRVFGVCLLYDDMFWTAPVCLMFASQTTS